MRQVRVGLFAVLPFLFIATATAAHAQQERLFQDSWFWGIHAGATSIGTPSRSTSEAATIGGEWLITRSMGGLYVAYDQTNFSRNSLITDASESSGSRPVSIHNMRTVSLGGVVFPYHRGAFRPYAGLGFAISVLGNATAQPDSLNAPPTQDASQRTQDASSRSTVFGLLGAQWQIRRTAVFAQLTAMPGSSDFLINKPMTTITAGVRYNFGTSIER